MGNTNNWKITTVSDTFHILPFTLKCLYINYPETYAFFEKLYKRKLGCVFVITDSDKLYNNSDSLKSLRDKDYRLALSMSCDMDDRKKLLALFQLECNKTKSVIFIINKKQLVKSLDNFHKDFTYVNKVE